MAGGFRDKWQKVLEINGKTSEGKRGQRDRRDEREWKEIYQGVGGRGGEGGQPFINFYGFGARSGEYSTTSLSLPTSRDT